MNPVGVILPLCRDAVGTLYSSKRRGHKYLNLFEGILVKFLDYALVLFFSETPHVVDLNNSKYFLQTIKKRVQIKVTIDI